jgi:two-component system phosphate regulon sensor histidine kinase PhoR
MKTSRVLIRFLIGYLLLHLITAGLFVVVFSRATRTQMVNNAKGEMQSLALMLRSHINELPAKIENQDLPNYLLALGKETDFRFTAINVQGNVVADSVTGFQDIGPHGDRPEIQQAQKTGLGFSSRFSDTLQKPMLYLAIPYQANLPKENSNDPLGYIRVAAPAAAINNSILQLQRSLWTFAIILGVATATLMTIFANRAMRPLGKFSAAARSIGSGKLVQPILDPSEKLEWSELSDAFRQMQKQIILREGQLRESSQRLQTVLSSMIEGVISTDGDGRISLANKAALRMLSFAQAGVINRELLEVIRYPELRMAIEKSRSDHSTAKAEFETLSPTRRTIQARATYLPDEPDHGVAIVLHDVTELRALETMRRDFVANVSHELKTPLASIKAYAETLRLGAIHDDQKNIQFLDQIETQAELLNRQIQDLLEIARIESGSAAFKIETVELNTLCERSVKHLLPQALQRDVKLVFNSENETLNADAEANGVVTILNNLISNAIHYTPAGGQVTVKTRLAGEFSIIEVIDTGIGISQEHQTRVFERFYRVDKARSRDLGGTGLGLSIVKHLTQSMGGQVELESQIGKGSTFRVCLPTG